MHEKRIEKDTLGTRELPNDVYYGIQTLRAIENFPISGITPHKEFIHATALIKRAAAEAHLRLGLMNRDKAEAIIKASEEVCSGRFDDQFVVDAYQAGAGTSHNMNTNEVIANRAIEILGGKRGDYSIIHPNDDVNKAQSTNDVIPTAMRLACLSTLNGLLKSLKILHRELKTKGRDFDDIIKSGRTHLQDAVPIRLGQEFSAYATSIKKHIRRIKGASEELKVLGIGGTAVGTGLNAHPRYREMVIDILSRHTGIKLTPSDDLFESMQSMASFSRLSGSLRDLSIDLIRIANDLRLMSSGPMAGLAEIELPTVQPGSSIMPGKVNPVMAEALNMVCFQVIGNDTTIAMASQAGQLELNVMMPVIAYNLLQSIEILKNGIRVFAERCIKAIRAKKENCRFWLERSLGIVTALSPYIGYQKAAELAKEAYRERKGIKEIAIKKGILSEEELDSILDFKRLTSPGIAGR